ncbi:MAG: GTP 3',8-cyclase MoaA [Bdellovibrionales bacterium]|nr:GTP 3',8-cyclase MoaA [Bdellovibrionales bacterium]
MSKIPRDSLGREFHYLRLSVTEQCNFKCAYCLPNGYRPKTGNAPDLSLPEIRRLVAGFARLGFWKVRLTGGEPTVRRDILELAHTVADIEGIRRVALSTNGSRLKAIAPHLRMHGVSAINVSVDSLNPAAFRQITGADRLNEVLEGIEAALDCGIEKVKLNVVLLRGLNDHDLDDFLEYVRCRPVSLRFIELMGTGGNTRGYFDRHHVSAGPLRLSLLRSGWTQREREPGGGPAVEYSNPGFSGSIGVIAPYSEDFCRSCNRLRVSSTGSLRLCLFGAGEESLRDLLQEDGTEEEIASRVLRALRVKPDNHRLQEGIYGITEHLAAIGG